MQARILFSPVHGLPYHTKHPEVLSLYDQNSDPSQMSRLKIIRFRSFNLLVSSEYLCAHRAVQP